MVLRNGSSSGMSLSTMDLCSLVLRKKRNVLALIVTLLSSLCCGYYLARYDNVCVSPVTSYRPESNLHNKGHPQGVISVLDHGCYLQAPNFTQYQHPPKLLAKRNCKRKVPAALIVGAALSGSLTLKSALSFHPDVVVPEFSVPFKDNDQYLDKMPYSLPDQITVGECQEFMYLRGLSNTTLRVFSSDLKIIFLIRDPVARAMSEYLALTSNDSSQFYRRSLSQYLGVRLETSKQEIHIRVKRNGNTRSYKSRDHNKSRKKARHKENAIRKRDVASSNFGMGRGKSPLHKTVPSQIRYNLGATFEETILQSPSEIDAVHFLVQRSIYALGIKHWERVVSRLNFLILDAEKFARSPADTMDIVERFLGLRPFFKKDLFDFDLLNGVFCFNSPVRSCVEPIPIQKPAPHISEEVVALLRQFFIPAMKIQNRFSDTYFPHLGENPLVFTPFR